MIARNLEDSEVWGVTDESNVGWWRQIVPIMRHYIDPGDADFEVVFGRRAEAAACAGGLLRASPARVRAVGATSPSFPVTGSAHPSSRT